MLATLCYKCVNEWLISHELEFASPFQEQRLHEFGLRGSSEKSTSSHTHLSPFQFGLSRKWRRAPAQVIATQRASADERRPCQPAISKQHLRLAITLPTPGSGE